MRNTLGELQIRRRRAVATIAALAVPAAVAVSLLASGPAAASRPLRSHVVYCIPPSGAKAAATQNASSTASTLSTFTEGSLASAGAVSVPVVSSSAGAIAIKLTSGKTLIGSGSLSVTEAGCFELTITLTAKGKQLLAGNEASKTPTSVLITSTFTPVRGSGKMATVTKTVTLQP
jgi:hypothetical protein